MAKAGSSKKSSGSSSQTTAGSVGPRRLSTSEIETALAGVPEWAEVGGSIQRTFAFSNFVQSMEFVTNVAAVAEADAHHPEILIRYNKVTLSLNTHDAGGITSKDFALATKADELAGLIPPAVKAPKTP